MTVIATVAATTETAVARETLINKLVKFIAAVAFLSLANFVFVSQKWITVVAVAVVIVVLLQGSFWLLLRVATAVVVVAIAAVADNAAVVNAVVATAVVATAVVVAVDIAVVANSVML